MHVQRRSADTLIANPSYALQDFGFNTSPYPVRDPCSESYAGAKPFEALETQALSRYMLDEQNNIKLFFAETLILEAVITSLLPSNSYSQDFP